MLDQNTDRMWYVIGAVLVGAAIILIANGAMPEMFASVADNFQNTTNKAADAVSKIVPFSNYYERVLDDFTNFLNQPDSWQQGGIMGGGGSSINDFVMRTDYLELPPGKYTLRTSSDRDYDVRMSMTVYSQPVEEILYDEIQLVNGREQHGEIIDDSGFISTTSETTGSHTFVVPEEGRLVRLRVLYADKTDRKWVREEWIPEVEVPLLNFEITRHEILEEDAE